MSNTPAQSRRSLALKSQARYYPVEHDGMNTLIIAPFTEPDLNDAHGGIG